MKVFARVKVTRQQVQYAYTGWYGLWVRYSLNDAWKFEGTRAGWKFSNITNDQGMRFISIPDDAERVVKLKYSNPEYPFCGLTIEEHDAMMSDKGLPIEPESERQARAEKRAQRAEKAEKKKAEALEGNEDAQKKARELLIKRAADRAAKKKAISKAIEVMAAAHASDIPREGKVVYAYYRADAKGTQYAHCGEFGLWQWQSRNKQWVLRSRRPQRWFGNLAGTSFEAAIELPVWAGQACTIKDSKGFPLAGLTIEQLKSMAESTNS